MTDKNFSVSQNTPTSIDVYHLMSLLPVMPYYQIIDVGCADGTLSVQLAKLVYRGDLQAFDENKKNLTTTRQKFKQARLTNVKAKEIKDHALPIKNDTIDLATLSYLSERVEDPKKIIAESVRALKSSGWIAIIDREMDMTKLPNSVENYKKIAEKLKLKFNMKHNLSDEDYLLTFTFRK